MTTEKNIIVLTGAGISVSAGIPDFRSDKGIYAMLRDQHMSPESIFDIEYAFGISLEIIV